MSNYADTGWDPDTKKFLNFIGLILGFAGYWVLRAIGIPMPVLLILFLIWTVSWAIGWVAGRVLLNFVDGDGPVALILAWSLMAAWLVPALGLVLATTVGQLSKAAYSRRKLLLCLSALGIVASLVNATLSALANVHQQEQQMQTASQFEQAQ